MKALTSILIAAATATTTIAAMALPVNAGDPAPQSVQVTTGHFTTLPGGVDLGYDVTGNAVMYRTGRDGGTTTVRVRARGLDADTVYPAHVHNLPCSATPAGGSHYQNDVNGAVDAVNEIWPKITTDKNGHGVGFATHDAVARPDAMSIVIHYPANTSIRLACLDLT